MELKIKPYYHNNLCVIDTYKPFTQTFDCGYTLDYLLRKIYNYLKKH